MRVLIPLAGILLAALQTSCLGNNAGSNPGPWIMSSTPYEIEIRYDDGNRKPSDRLAGRHCAVHERNAQLRTQEDRSEDALATYDCR
jgi:hypothetical protein